MVLCQRCCHHRCRRYQTLVPHNLLHPQCLHERALESLVLRREVDEGFVVGRVHVLMHLRNTMVAIVAVVTQRVVHLRRTMVAIVAVVTTQRVIHLRRTMVAMVAVVTQRVVHLRRPMVAIVAVVTQGVVHLELLHLNQSAIVAIDKMKFLVGHIEAIVMKCFRTTIVEIG
ncbi:hypothetical protein L195_g050644 [Trifolium pratense]|uniref:Uncharacterized protein n=1 Tax=Trifolium pratense TaxID=57577 RepID=A0A2K3JV65_TRIPR|nr:hypothetical protein L195_g050644 [Trifolium pratense]